MASGQMTARAPHTPGSVRGLPEEKSGQAVLCGSLNKGMLRLQLSNHASARSISNHQLL